MKTLSLCLLFSLSVSCASSGVGKALNVGVLGSATADYVTTRQAINSGRGHEGNWILGESAIRQALLKAFGASFVIGAAAYVEAKGKPEFARVIQIMAIAAYSAASVHNYQIARVR